MVSTSLVVLLQDGANNCLRFFDLRKDGIMELGGKSSLILGLESKMCKCFLMMRPTLGRFGLSSHKWK